MVTDAHHSLVASRGMAGKGCGQERHARCGAAQPRAAGLQEPSVAPEVWRPGGYSAHPKAALLSCLGRVTSWQIKGMPCARGICALERKKKFFLPFLGFLKNKFPAWLHQPGVERGPVPVSPQEPGPHSPRLRLRILFPLKV